MSILTGLDLSDLLQHVGSPAVSGYSVKEVPQAPGYLIGRGIDGGVALLTPFDANPDPPTRLRNLRLDPKVRVRVEDAATGHEADYGLVEMGPVDDEMLEPFLGVAAALIRLLGPHPAPRQVSLGLRRLVQIFDPFQPARGSVLGLWAELLLISNSVSVNQLVDAWHAHVDARFDFSAEGTRLEVKATTLVDRIHRFNLHQLKPVAGAKTIVASVMTTETLAGTSILELISRLEHRLSGDVARQTTIHQVVAQTLGADWMRSVSQRFDAIQAEESLVLLDPAQIPQVHDVPDAVREVTLTVDCSDVAEIDSPSGLAALVRR